MARVTHRRARPLALLVLLLLPLLWGSYAAPAFAHDRLVSTTPASGVSVTSPTSVQLRFAEKVVSTGTRIEVKDPRDKVVSSDLRVTGDVVSVRLAQPTTAGTYRVVWRITSDDGHPVSGGFSFRAAPAAGATATATSSTTTSSAGASSSSSPVPTQQVPTNATNNAPWLIIGAVVIAVLAIAGGVVVSRRRLKDDEPSNGAT
nr:copper resistance protein CopC [Allobranchiibius sp. GilTou38]